MIEGKLTNIKTGGKFVFDVKKGNRRYNQKHYEAIGEVSIATLQVFKKIFRDPEMYLSNVFPDNNPRGLQDVGGKCRAC